MNGDYICTKGLADGISSPNDGLCTFKFEGKVTDGNACRPYSPKKPSHTCAVASSVCRKVNDVNVCVAAPSDLDSEPTTLPIIPEVDSKLALEQALEPATETATNEELARDSTNFSKSDAVTTLIVLYLPIGISWVLPFLVLYA